MEGKSIDSDLQNRWINSNLFMCLRPVNLIIVGLTQYLFYRFLFKPLEGSYPLVLSGTLLFMFIATTVIITASGYLINDYFDFEGDRINQKKYRLANKWLYLLYYFTLITIGFFLSLFIALQIGEVLLAIIYLIACAALFYYSSHLKRKPLSGNLLVAAFSAFVLLIICLFEYQLLLNLIEDNNLASRSFFTLISFYLSFMFLLSFIRELIKDLEDRKGDVKTNALTLAVINKERTFFIIKCGSLILLIASVVFTCLQTSEELKLLSLAVITLPQLFLFLKIYKKVDSYHLLSKICKINMLLGLIFLPLSHSHLFL